MVLRHLLKSGKIILNMNLAGFNVLLLKNIKYSNMEKLDINNVLEAQHIKKLISRHKYLVDFFDTLIKKVNIELNTEKAVHSMPIEDLNKSSSFISTDSEDDFELDQEELKFLKGINEKKDEDLFKSSDD
jgi:hypothetical protein